MPNIIPTRSPQKEVKHVRICRGPWETITSSAATNVNEVIGILLGRQVGTVVHVEQARIYVPEESTPDSIYWEGDSYCASRAALLKECPNLLILGTWHTHPWEEFEIDVLTPQLNHADIDTIQDGEIEIIAVAFPPPHWYKWKNHRGQRVRRRRVAGKEVRVEAWRKVVEPPTGRRKKPKVLTPCMTLSIGHK